MKKIILIAILSIMQTATFAQVSLDSLVKRDKKIDSDKEYLIYEYRLPQWSYKQFYFNISGGINGSDEESSDNSMDNTSTNIIFRPYYYSYTESEERISSLQASLYTTYNYRKQHESNEFSTSDSKIDDLDFGLDFNYNLQKYFDENCYYTLQSHNSFLYNDAENNYKENYLGNISEWNLTYIQRHYENRILLGTGYGRVRNVTPIFRALRFSERLRQLKGYKDLSTDEIAELAGFFTLKSTYGITYDRSDKYFYSDLPENILYQLYEMKPWEVLYLDEVWNEIIGNRYEGFDADGGILIHYNKDDYSSPAQNTELFLLGFYVEQKYYHNLNSFYQVGTEFYASHSRVLNENTMYDYFGQGRFKFLNLWNLTDRMLLNLDLTLESGFGSDKSWKRFDNYFSDLTLTYFIENNLSANTQIHYNFSKSRPESFWFTYDSNSYSSWYKEQEEWFIQFNLRYFLDRGIL